MSFRTLAFISLAAVCALSAHSGMRVGNKGGISTASPQCQSDRSAIPPQWLPMFLVFVQSTPEKKAPLGGARR